jgi:hypothetical protein
MPFQRKRLLGSILCLVATAFATGCGGGGQDDGDPSATAGVGGTPGAAGAGPGGGTTSMPALVEGDRCSLGSSTVCGDCGCGLGDIACLALCDECGPVTQVGVICNGVCSDKCEYHDEADPACANAVAAEVEPGTCRVEATVKDRSYETTAKAYPQFDGLPEHGDCTRTMPSGATYSVMGGVAPGEPCSGSCPTVCEVALADFRSSCCGK